MDIKQLQILADIAEVGSLTRIGVIKGIAQSALSKQIGGLEKEFGSKLFYRTGRGVVLTEFGEAIMPRVKALLAESDQLKYEVNTRAGVPSGLVRIGIQSSVPRILIRILLQHIRQDYPQIRLRVMEGFTGYIEEWLASGRADVGVVTRYGLCTLRTDERLNAADLFLIGPIGDIETARRNVSFARLAGLPLVLPGLPDGLRMMLGEAAKTMQISLSLAIEIDSLAVMKDVVAAGGGYTILPMQAVVQEVGSTRLQAARIVEPNLSGAVVLATTTHRPLTTASREVVRLIRQLTTELVRSGQWPGSQNSSAAGIVRRKIDFQPPKCSPAAASR